jgi:hypothetical protein
MYVAKRDYPTLYRAIRLALANQLKAYAEIPGTLAMLAPKADRLLTGAPLA